MPCSCARKLVGDEPFAVVNSDDVYGVPALTRLAGHLAAHDTHAIVSFRLGDTIVTDDPVTRGTCSVRADGSLAGLVERRHVTRHADGTFRLDRRARTRRAPGATRRCR